uniref:Large ribosomal subunit protein uL3c n=1 Tax=Bulboplastis apyrenoidosa TaxID=1070855 RepID=A0A1Y9TMC1_9RHOD|nr:50S ribosomal protein L3 [Bulboplastis apyrenoidosa]ARO90784.1 50S ribosomal protein L3 [Bulboplastis apyrenoidosa]
MSLNLLGIKIGMSQIFDDKGSVIPVTIIQAGPCSVTNIKRENKDGYNAIQIGYFEISDTKVNKPILGYFKKIGLKPLKYLKEFRVDSVDEFNIGDQITVDKFTAGTIVDVRGMSIGKGFAGLQKRHNFHRGPMTHGSKNHRAPGSIGAGTTPGRVLPGKKMSGRLGNVKTTIKNLEVINVENENNLIILKGSVPGKNGNLLEIISLNP